MVNLGLNWSSLLGIILAVSGAGLYFLRSWRPKLARDHDIFFAAIGLLCGGILLFQGWRLDPILAFGQFLLTGSAIFFAVESIRLRGLATAQAKGRSSSRIVDEDRYVSDVYRVDAELDELEPIDEYQPMARQIRGSRESSNRYEDEDPRRSSSRRSTTDRPRSSDRPRRRPVSRPDSRSRSYSDEWEASVETDSTLERPSRSRRPSSRTESPVDRSDRLDNRWDDVNPTRSTSKPRKNSPIDDTQPTSHSRDRLSPDNNSTDYVDYRPVDYSDDDFGR
ncbi:MAG: Ycf66 family protein [Cyanobacteriota bacterium]|nr:Ycf66 family protein [Cyanobacteriota bacterium]